MIPENMGKQLHDKATRGLPLSTDEQAMLLQWYAQVDKEEGKHLATAARPPDLAALRQQVQANLAEIIAVSQKIQTMWQWPG
jgi:hypothetical protein